MNLKNLFDILAKTTISLRKGEIVEDYVVSGVRITEIFTMPHESEARPDLERVDMEMLTIGVDKAKAELRRADVIAILSDYPEPERLVGGPSYIEVGATLGSQEAALQLFALGKVLGLWHVITPRMLGIEGDDAKKMAGQGCIMISGFDKDKFFPADR